MCLCPSNIAYNTKCQRHSPPVGFQWWNNWSLSPRPKVGGGDVRTPTRARPCSCCRVSDQDVDLWPCVVCALHPQALRGPNGLSDNSGISRIKTRLLNVEAPKHRKCIRRTPACIRRRSVSSETCARVSPCRRTGAGGAPQKGFVRVVVARRYCSMHRVWHPGVVSVSE